MVMVKLGMLMRICTKEMLLLDLSSRVEQLEKRVNELEKEISELKQRNAGKTGVVQTHRPQVNVPPWPQPANIQSKEQVKREEKDWEHLIARVWLPRVFMLVLLIGLIWGFKAAVEGGYITEGMRCILGYLVAGVFVYMGYKQHRENRPLLSQALLGGSIGVLMLTTFAAHYLYSFIGIPVAFVLNVSWVILGIWFSNKFNSQALGVLASAAGVLTPFLVQSHNPSPTFFIIYEVILYVGFMVYAIRSNFVKLFYASFVLLHVALMFYGLTSWHDRKIIAFGALVQHIVLFVSIFVQRNLMKQQIRSLITSFALTALWFKIAMPAIWFENTMLVFLAGYAILSLWLWKNEITKLPYSLTIATYAGLFYLTNIVSNDSLPALLLFEGFVALGLGFVIHSKLQKINGLIVYLLGGMGAIEVLADGMDTVISSHLFVWLTLFITLPGIAKLVSKFRIGSNTEMFLRILYYGIGALFLFFLTDVTNALTQKLSNNAQHLLVSTVWVAYSIVVISIGVLKSMKKVRLAGIALLFLTLIKVIFFDLPTVSVLIKAVLFIGLGGIGVILSRLFYKKES